jgi:hypothetical protein
MGEASKNDKMKNKFFTCYDYRAEAIQSGFARLLFFCQQVSPVELPQ